MQASSPLFSELTDEDMQSITARGTVKSYPKHAILINEGDQSDFLYVILEGKVKVFASDDKGKEVILNLQGPGEYFGELALIDQVPRSASVMTLTPTRVVFISRAEFESHLADHPEVIMKLLRGLTMRIREMTDIVKDLALNDVYGRVARTLRKLSRERDGQYVVEQRLTHQDIADMVGASREMVSRIMKDLTTGGYIEVKNKIITIRHKLPPAW